jgi:hypothetical protein
MSSKSDSPYSYRNMTSSERTTETGVERHNREAAEKADPALKEENDEYIRSIYNMPAKKSSSGGSSSDSSYSRGSGRESGGWSDNEYSKYRGD